MLIISASSLMLT